MLSIRDNFISKKGASTPTEWKTDDGTKMWLKNWQVGKLSSISRQSIPQGWYARNRQFFLYRLLQLPFQVDPSSIFEKVRRQATCTWGFIRLFWYEAKKILFQWITRNRSKCNCSHPAPHNRKTLYFYSDRLSFPFLLFGQPLHLFFYPYEMSCFR